MTSENLITAPVGTTLEQAQCDSGEAPHREAARWWTTSGILRGLITIKDIEKAHEVPELRQGCFTGRLLCGAAVGVTP